MPIFEHRCRKCGVIYEHLKLPGDKDTPKCTGCGSRSNDKLISRPGLDLGYGTWHNVTEKRRKY